VLINTSGGDADNAGFYLADGNSTAKIVREGQRAPGRGFFTSLTTGVVNNQDTVLFESGVSLFLGGSADSRGVFLSDGSQIVEAMRSGDALGNSTITDVGQLGQSFNDDGQFTYRANLANGKTLVGRFTPDLHYRSTTSGNWDDRTNWTVGIGPNDVHDVFIDSASDVTVTGPASNTTVRSLTIGGEAGQSTLVLPGGTGGIRVLNQARVAQNGVLAGNGRIDGDIVIDGTLSPGNSAGQISMRGSLDMNSTARFEVELGGLLPIQYDGIFVFGNVELDGVLDVKLINGFNLSDGDEFLIVQSSRNIAGHFLNLPDESLVGRFGNQDLFISYNSSGGDVTLFSRLSSVPEPRSAVLAGLIAGSGLFRRRKRVKA
jgi:hypothetical protein